MSDLPLDTWGDVLARMWRAIVADLMAAKAKRDRDARRVSARLAMRERCRRYFADLLAQHGTDGAVRTVDPVQRRR